MPRTRYLPGVLMALAIAGAPFQRPHAPTAGVAYAQHEGHSGGGSSGDTSGMDMSGRDQGAGGQKGAAMPGMKPPVSSRTRLYVLGGVGLLALLAVVMSYRRGMRLSPRAVVNRGTVLGTGSLIVILVATLYVVRNNRKAGSMTVIEAQAMDMSVMKPPVGAAPVAVEKLARRDFQAAVTYTGTAVARNDEDVYPRVVGRIVSLPVYPGDQVKPGQLVARLDSVELSAREREALYGRAAAQRGREAANAEVTQAVSSRVQAEAEADRAKGAVTEAQRGVARSQAAIQEGQSDLKATQEGLKQAQSELTALGHEKGGTEAEFANAEAGLADAAAEVEKSAAEAESVKADSPQAEAEVESAKADAAYWDAELKRETKLHKEGAVSLEEYQREEAQAKAAQAKLRQAQARVGQVKHNIDVASAAVRAAQAKAKQTEAQIRRARSDIARLEAKIEGGRAMVAGKEAEIERARARIAQSQAEAEGAGARVEQARAMVRGTEAMIDNTRAAVRISAAKTGEAEAMINQSAASLTAASTVRGYTEIRATVSGVVIQRLVSPGVLVSPGAPLLRIAEIDPIRLQANVAEQDLKSIRVGNPVRVTSAKHPEEVVVTRVTSVFPAVDPTARTAVVEALTPNPGKQFLPGEFLTMAIVTDEIPNALTVPNQALVRVAPEETGTFFTEKQPAVWIARERKATGKMQYYCTMHPEVVQDKPGKCPKCNMKLDPKTKGGK
jgi:HlyD family secretion protein